jgi:hypothetical protein
MKIKHPLPIIFLILSNTLPFDSWSQWVQISAGSGQTTGPQVKTISTSNTGKIFAGTPKGIYTSKNNGTSWKPSNYGLTDGSVNSFSTNGNSVFVAMNSGGGVLRSIDDGETWNKVNNGLPQFAVIDLESVNGRVLALINNYTVFYSDDNGDSWLQMTNTPSKANSLARSGTTIFIGSTSGVYRSANSGTSWLLVNSGLSNPNVISMDATENTIVVWTTSGMFTSTNNGSLWNSASLPIGYPNIAQIGSTILVSYVQGLMWRSINNGVSWAIVQNVPTAGKLLSVGSYFFASTVQGVYLSKDNGITWSSANVGLADSNPSLSADGSVIITTDGIKVRVSQDWGATWIAQTVGSTFNTSVLARKNVLYVSNRNGVFSSINNGLTWASIPALGTEKTLGYGEDNLYAADSYYLYRSANGAPWFQQSSVVRWISTFAAKGTKVFAGSIFGGDAFTGVFASVNGGITWQQVNNSLPQINSMAYDGALLVCGTSSGVYKSVNDGVTWTLCGLQNININSVIFDNGRILAAHEGIEVSNDNGVTWASITGEISSSLAPYHQITTLTKSGTRILAATSTGDVWISKCSDLISPSISGAWNHHPTILSSSSPANNQWFLNGIKIIGATEQKLEINTSGAYSVKVIVDGCTSEMSSPFVITDCIIPPKPTISLSGVNPQFTLTSSSSQGNQWFINGALIQDALGENYTPNVTGNFSVQVTINGCKSNMSAPYPLVITGDIQTQNTEIKIYPNPVINELNILSGSSGGIEQFTAKIYDLYGRVIQNEIISNSYPISINTSFLVSGCYVIEFNQVGRIFRCRFVKN